MTGMHAESQQFIALIKFFSEKEHYLAFKRGISIFRTPHYYRLCEDVGRGDRAESCIAYWDKKFGGELPRFEGINTIIDLENSGSILIYPVVEQKDSWLQSWCGIGSFNNFSDSIEKMLNEFGSYFVLLPVEHINSYANLIRRASGCEVRYGFIGYSDDLLHRSLSIKDSKFSYQKEFRFYVGECDKHEVKEKVLSLDGVSSILLDASSMRIEDGDCTKYFSLGSKKVISN